MPNPNHLPANRVGKTATGELYSQAQLTLSQDKATLEYAVKAYGHLIARNSQLSFAEFADLIAKQYDPTTPRNAAIIQLLRAHQGLPAGWSEAAPDSIATNPDPIMGGIIDSRVIDGLWFFVANRDGHVGEGYLTRHAAFQALDQHLASAQS